MLRLDRDAGYVIVDKPWGLPTSGRTLDDPDCLQGWLMAHLRRRRVWAVHQLDKDTSGANVFVLRKRLVQAFAARLKQAAAKTYLAIVHGELRGHHTVDAALGRIDRDGRTFPAVCPGGKPSTTEVDALATAGGFTLVRAIPATGRTHQVRLHLAHLGHPLVGEPLHRAPPCTLHHRHALHAWRLALGADVGPVEAPWPADLATLATRLGLPDPPKEAH